MKCCNHLLAVNIAGVACRGLWCMCGKILKDKGTGISKSIVASFLYLVWLLFGDSITTVETG